MSIKVAIIGAGSILFTRKLVGDILTIKSILGADEELHELLVVGVTDSRKYSIQPSIFVPYQTWDQIKPRAAESNQDEELIFNLIAVQSDNSVDFGGEPCYNLISWPGILLPRQATSRPQMLLVDMDLHGSCLLMSRAGWADLSLFQ